MMIKRQLGVGTIALVFCFMLTALGSTMPSFAESMGETQEKSLYERLGGYDAISAVVDVFLTKIWEDPVVGRFFVGMGTDTRNLLRQKTRTCYVQIPAAPAKELIAH